jgi:hypothetical protein
VATLHPVTVCPCVSKDHGQTLILGKVENVVGRVLARHVMVELQLPCDMNGLTQRKGNCFSETNDEGDVHLLRLVPKRPFPWDQGVHAPRQEGQTHGPTDPLSKTTTTQLRMAVILPGQRRAGIVGFLDTERQQWPHWLCPRWWRWGEWRSDEGCRRRWRGL